MTYEQINALTLNDVISTVFYRLTDLSALSQGESPWELTGEATYDNYVFNIALVKPTIEECEAELVIYKAELTAAEDTRIAEEAARIAELARIATIKLRLSVFSQDPVVPLVRLGLIQQQPNWAIWHKQIIEQNDIALLTQLETEWSAYQSELSIQASQSTVERLRNERDAKLYESDWTQLADAPLTSEEKTKYRTYRRYLRSLPAIWEGSHIAEPICLDFEDWQANPPIYPEGI